MLKMFFFDENLTCHKILPKSSLGKNCSFRDYRRVLPSAISRYICPETPRSTIISCLHKRRQSRCIFIEMVCILCLDCKTWKCIKDRFFLGKQCKRPFFGVTNTHCIQRWIKFDRFCRNIYGPMQIRQWNPIDFNYGFSMHKDISLSTSKNR